MSERIRLNQKIGFAIAVCSLIFAICCQVDKNFLRDTDRADDTIVKVLLGIEIVLGFCGIVFFLWMIYILLSSFKKIRKTSTNLENKDTWLLNLQIVQIGLFFAAGMIIFVGHFFLEINVRTSKTQHKMKFYAVISVTGCLLVTAAMLIGIYTIKLYADSAKPASKK